MIRDLGTTSGVFKLQHTPPSTSNPYPSVNQKIEMPKFRLVNGRLIDENGFPRRSNLHYLTAEEKMLYDAHVVVERMGAHELLTQAACAILEAKSKLADWIDTHWSE